MTDLDVSIFWDDSPDLWDTVVLGDEELPGVARVRATHGRKIDSKSSPGSNGARIVDKGYEAAKVEITLRIWKKEQLETWFRIAPTLTYRREPPAREVVRPTLGEATVTTNVLLGVSVRGAAQGLTEQQIVAEQERQLAIALPNRRTARARALVRHDFAISHPALDTLQIHRVYIEEVSTPDATSGGVYEVKIKAIESKQRAGSSRSISSRSTAGQSFATGIETAFGASDPVASGAARP